MNTIFGSLGGAIACGLIAYFVVRGWLPEVDPNQLTNVIGLIALLGGVATAIAIRRFKRDRPTGGSERHGA